MRRSANHSPNDYTITDSIREWAAEKYGAPYLPDVFREDWVETAAINGSTYAKPELSLMRWIRKSSPAGEYYHPKNWEMKLKAAKKLGQPARLTPIKTYTPTGPTESLPQSVRAASRAALATLMAKLS